jgi:hypothetical protein
MLLLLCIFNYWDFLVNTVESKTGDICLRQSGTQRNPISIAFNYKKYIFKLNGCCLPVVEWRKSSSIDDSTNYTHEIFHPKAYSILSGNINQSLTAQNEGASISGSQ